MPSNYPLETFIDLVSNVMEAYTTALFLVEEGKEAPLRLISFHSFSKHIQKDCLVHPGEGIVGWVHREEKAVLVSHFERSTTTLKFYEKDEAIKSLLAVPLPERAGVLYVDSKKSYRFTEQREKICRQMAATALDLWNAQQEGLKLRMAENLLALSLEMDDLLLQTSRKDFLGKALELLGRRLGLTMVFFAVPGRVICYSQGGSTEGKYHHRLLPVGSFSPEGLLGWCIKNRKKILRRQIGSGRGKSFVLHKEENMGTIHNFIGLPVFLEGKTVCGGVGMVRPENQHWQSLEIETAARLAQLFFRSWMAAEKDS